MTDHTRRRSVRKVDARQEVLKWLNRGVRCVPIVPGKKKPKGGEGWNKLRITESTIADHFELNDSFGGLWGEPSNWVVDVDLDWEQSAIIARHLLPETFVYGRTGRKETHYLYRCEGIKTEKFISPDKEIDESERMIVEIRSTGTQSVLPGSTHEAGQYITDHDREIKTLSIESLRALIRRVAGLAILAQEYPQGGGHDYMHAVTGALMHSNWAKDDVWKACNAIVMAVGNLEDHPEQRTRTIKNTIDKHESSTTYGWPTLEKYMSALNLSTIRRWLTIDAGPAMPEKIIERKSVDVEIPKHLLNPPGLTGDICAWAAKRSYIKQPVMDLAVALTCMAMISCNRYIVDDWDTPLQPYFMMLAPTATGKDVALKSVYYFCRRLRLHDYCFQGFQSYHSMLDKLGEAPGLACWLWDEAGRKLKSAGKGGNSQDYQVITWILGLYGQAASHVPGLTARGNNIDAMDFPFMTILAASQPNVLMQAVTEAELDTGLINRFLMFDTGDRVPEDNEQRQDIFASNMEKQAVLIRNRSAREGEFPFHRIGFETDVYAMFRAFRKACIYKAGELWGRANQNALIIAGLLTLGMGGDKPKINVECAQWAIDFVTWSVGCWESRMIGGVSRTKTEGHSKDVEGYIRNARRVTGAWIKPRHREMLKRGLMPRTVLVRLSRHLNARELTEVISQLKGGELIAEGDEDGTTVYAPL